MRPPEYQRPFDVRFARRFFLRFGVVVIALIAAFQSISFYVESLWFASLGFEPVYWYRLKAEATCAVQTNSPATTTGPNARFG